MDVKASKNGFLVYFRLQMGLMGAFGVYLVSLSGSWGGGGNAGEVLCGGF